MLIDKGLNDKWVKAFPWKNLGKGRYVLTLQEPLGKYWAREIVSYASPARIGNKTIRILYKGERVLAQRSGDSLAILVEDLKPHEKRVYTVEIISDDEKEGAAGDNIQFGEEGSCVIFSNGLIELKLPGSRKRATDAPGPIIAVRREKKGPWLGRGSLESPFKIKSIKTRVIEKGELWTTVEVAYAFEGGYAYRVRLQLRSGEEACEIFEESTLPLRLWPAPRPYREIGSLGKSFWDQPTKDIAKPCLRPCPTSNFIFDIRPGLRADRLVTHSTASWEIIDLPLGAAGLKTYTAMRPALPNIDGGWMGVYHDKSDSLLGIASVDIAHWKTPDDRIHPVHCTPGANAEVLLVDSKDGGSHFRFPIENLTRRWLLTVVSREASRGLGEKKKPRDKPVRLEPDYNNPLWTLRNRRGDLRLDKVKDWIVDWPDAKAEHPRVLCRRSDFREIRKKMKMVPEFKKDHAKYKRWRAADRYILTGERGSLKEVEAATHVKELLGQILEQGFAGRNYCIGFTRPLRRYTLACDILWESFTPEEKREARRVCALAAYILSDGDWWQYAYRSNETTYLPNFNSDVFTCMGILGLFLNDHPCSKIWVQGSVQRMNIELKYHVRSDGGGEENFSHYYFSTWMMLYMPLLWALRRGGVKDYSKDARVLAAGRYMLKVMGPPDPRDGNLRQIPPIGDHPYARKAFPVLDWMASFVKKSDPALAEHLKWAWRACGSPVGNFFDHFGPTANPLTRHYIFHDPKILSTPPKLESYNLPYVGAVLRSHDESGKGSFLFLKAGRVYCHHHADEGSFHYFGRGVPLALDGLPIQNGSRAYEHNAVTFSKPGQPTGIVEAFKTTSVADYVRARIAPRAFPSDSAYADDTHRSGWEREIVLVKARKPGGIEYLVIKDTASGPEACQWNMDVLSRKPEQRGNGRVWFPGHPEFNMGLDVIITEPAKSKIVLEQGVVNPKLLNARTRRKLPWHEINWPITEHWLMHLSSPPGTTFFMTLFPRRANEMAPVVEYLEREETVSIRHAEGRDLIFLRPNPMVGTNLGGTIFQGRAGILSERGNQKIVQPLDASCMKASNHLHAMPNITPKTIEKKAE